MRFKRMEAAILQRRQEYFTRMGRIMQPDAEEGLHPGSATNVPQSRITR
jgi:hypothetical protein